MEGRAAIFGIPHPQDIFTTEKKRRGVGFICIDPQDSDGKRLERKGRSTKCGPDTSAAVFKGK